MEKMGNATWAGHTVSVWERIKEDLDSMSANCLKKCKNKT